MEAWYTIAVIKPDAYAKRKEILMKIGQNNMVVVHALDVEFTPVQVRSFYPEHVNKDYFGPHLGHMCSGRSLVLKLKCRKHAKNPIVTWRHIMGPTNPDVARQDGDSLRAHYGLDLPRNAFHGSDSWESAICEAAVFGV